MIDRHATPTLAADPESKLVADDELGPDAWHRLPHETCRRISLAWTSVWRLLRSSPLFERSPEGLFRLVGSGERS
jgi:hypothetical protein